MTKKNNHLLPRLVIKRWENNNALLFNKSTNRSRKIRYLDYSKKYYYSLGKVDDALENRISAFESYIGNILNGLDKAKDSFTLSSFDACILKLYVILQSCRNENTSPVILSDESGIYQNNNYLFGVPLVTTQEEAVSITSKICDDFETLIRLKNGEIKNDKEISFNFNFVLSFLHLVIASNPDKSFLVSETTAIIECDMDGNFLYTYVPVSPNKALILAKSKYFNDEETINQTKIRLGAGIPDEYLSCIIDDYKLMNTTKQFGSKLTFDIVELSKTEVQGLNSIIYEDGDKILFCNQEALEHAKTSLECRKIKCG